MGLKLTLATENNRTTKFTSENSKLPESILINDLIENKVNDEIRIRTSIGNQEYKMLNNLNSQICILELNGLSTEIGSGVVRNSVMAHFATVVRTAFEQHAFRPFMTIIENRLVILAFNLLQCKTKKDCLIGKERLQQIYKQIEKIMNKENRKKLKLFMGIGGVYKGFRNIHIGFGEAKKAIFLKSFYQSPVISYDELGAFQILLSLHEQGLLKSFVLSHLGPLIEVDQKKNSDLLKTLKIYLESNGSKQSVAEELHIVRQSLYYRLEKIKELLGEDYMETQKRLALQLAIQAYELLNYEEMMGCHL